MFSIGEEVVAIVSMCKAEPQLHRNLELAREVLAGLGDVYAPVSIDCCPASKALWDVWFPDHCTANAVFFVGVTRNLLTGRYSPTIVVSCSHFEHGEDADELAALSVLLRTVCREAGFLSCAHNIRLLSNTREVLVATVESEEEYDYIEAAKKALKLAQKEEINTLPEWLF